MKRKRKHKAKKTTPRKPRKRFHVVVHSNWDPMDWEGGVQATISTTASLGPGKAVVNRIVRDVIRSGLVRVVDELCEGQLSTEQALLQLGRP